VGAEAPTPSSAGMLAGGIGPRGNERGTPSCSAAAGSLASALGSPGSGQTMDWASEADAWHSHGRATPS